MIKLLIRKWLGIQKTHEIVVMLCTDIMETASQIEALQKDFNSRDCCKICGKHRYNSPLCLVEAG